MKQTILFLGLAFFAPALLAQTKPAPKPAPKPTTKPAASKAPVANPLKNGNDSMSYAIGLSLAQFYKQQGIEKFNSTLVTKGITDAVKGTPLLNEEQMNMSISNYLQQMKAEKAAVNKQAGAAFLAANKTKPGVVTLPSGLQYQIVKEGTGAKPTINDKVKCHYHGTLIDGTIFDSSVERGQPIDFPVNGVIRGWVEALQLMPVGSKWKLFIPSELGYGDNQAGAKIGPGSTLIFDVELIDIVK
jgi:FKBP-type peptidyl-prolyl cis-trans isomerase FklB